MEIEVKKTHLARHSSLFLSFMVMIASPFLLIALDGIGRLIMLSSNSAEILLCSFYPISITVICFLYIKHIPKAFGIYPLFTMLAV